jgi:hypothetical protein
MLNIPLPIAEITARTEQVAQESWIEAERAGVQTDSKEAFLNAIRIAYVKGIHATLEALQQMQTSRR